MAREESRTQENYYNVLADGKFHLTVPEGTEGAVLRKYETSDGTTGEKWEKLYQSISGKITKVDFYDGTYGKSLLLTIEDEGEDPCVVSLGTASNFGEDMLKKILSIDMEQPVKLVPFSLIDEKTKKNRKGITVYQGGDKDEHKVKSFFHSYNPDTKVTTPKNGYPAMPKAKKGKDISSDEWKLFFMQARLFMIDKVTDHFGIGAKEDTGGDL